MQARYYEFLKNKNECEVLITKDDKCSTLFANVAKFCGLKPFVLPDFRANFGDDLRAFSEELTLLLFAISAYEKEASPKKVLITPLKTILNPLPQKRLLETKTIDFAASLDIKALKDTLLFWGYTFVDIVEERGECSFRGDIIDIFSIGEEEPTRILLFDDTVESIRKFSPENQKSFKDELESFTFSPTLFSFKANEYEQIIKKIETIQSDAFVKDIHSLGFWALDESQTISYLHVKQCYFESDLTKEIEEIASFQDIDTKFLHSLPILNEPKVYKDIVVSDITNFLNFHKNKKVTLLAKSEVSLKQAGIFQDKNIKFLESPLVVNIMSDEQIIISLNAHQTKKRRRKRPSIILDELKINDYVVHENYGIGIFKGLVTTTVLGATKDFVEIHYQGDDKLLLPVENIDIIDRYISESGTLAIVDKLGKGSFARLKEKAKAKLFEIAQEIIEIAAKRELIDARKIYIDKNLLYSFQNKAGFTYTKDQVKSIDDILYDLNSGTVMDRLLSADVGFGKTEVAMNAILATIKSGFQTLFIAPTTLLSTQHFKSLKERLGSFGVEIRKLDRFTTPKEKKAIKEGLENKSVHVVVGTHALLGINATNLGLLVIDEEHKFGVKQKEKLKQLRENVHLLSMSATPIPRSLNMALSSIKQYSQMLTPPNDREDIRTFVKEYDESLLKEIILRELRRGGQIFFVHNRIASIEQKAHLLHKLLPNIRILTLHSKVTPSFSEKEMLRFENKEYDLLLSTSIIESGIHLPNVNTIIIENADRFGIADLHQLRGRVGRSSRQGYCYFLVEDKGKLTEQATKRLIALESNSYLGSGSVLAYHDLEIRGGGNLIGEAQSGHIKNIGYSLYLKMLEETINTLLNKQSVARKDIEMRLSISAYLSDVLIGEDRLRLELYRRLSKCESPNDVYKIEEEIEDRFGKLDTPTKQFLSMMIVKILASSHQVKSISNYAQAITITYEDDKKTHLKAKSKDDDDILDTLLVHFRKRN